MPVPRRHPLGYYTQPAAAAAASPWLRTADSEFTLLGAAGSITDGASDTLDLLLPDGTAAATFGDGISGLYSAAIWELGGTITGDLGLFLEWGTTQNGTVVVVGFLRASSAPSTLADLETDSVFLQVNINNTGKLNCFHKEEGQGLSAIHLNSDDLSSPDSVIFQAAAGPLGFERRQHISWNTSHDTQKDNLDSTVVAGSGDWYLFVGFGAAATVSGDTVINAKIKGGFRA